MRIGLIGTGRIGTFHSAALVGHPGFLELAVKVRPKWRRDERMLERLGL